MKHIPFFSFFLFCLTACVSSSRHKDLESRLGETQKQLSLQQGINAQLQKKLGEKSTSNTELEISVSEMQQALDELALRKKESEKRIEQYRQLTRKFKKLTDSGELKIKIIEGRMMLSLPSDVLFASGSSELSEGGHRTIVKTAQILSELADRYFQVEGHTDNIPIRTSRFPSNWELASARALTVLSTMIKAGMPANRISAASFAEHQPLADNSTPEGRQLNRRIEITIVPDLSMLPGHEELKALSEE